MKYTSKIEFSYADGYYGVLPSGLSERFYSGEGEYVYTEHYVIWFKPNTPNDIKERLTKEYAEYYEKQIVTGEYGA